MTRKEAERQTRQANLLMELGFTQTEAAQLRRISLALHRWGERECGNEHGCIERDEVTNKPYWVSSWGTQWGPGKLCRRSIPDRETGALKRLHSIINARNARRYVVNTDYYGLRRDEVQAYHQTDPRGAALYILRPGDIPEGKEVDRYYHNGLCIY